jgi:hypothetical protein
MDSSSREMLYVRDDVWAVPFDTYLRIDIRFSCCFATFHRFLLFVARLTDLTWHR